MSARAREQMEVSIRDAQLLDASNYKNGVKNNWRNAMWNQIRGMTRHPNEAVVLYLPAAANLDLQPALRRGFDRRNMIGVERDKKVAEHIRREYQQTVIDEDLADVLASWPVKHPVKIVVADLVHGLTFDVYRLFKAWSLNAAFRRGHLVVNLMRGRELHNPFIGLDKAWFVEAARAAGLPLKSRALHGVVGYNFALAHSMTLHLPERERIAGMVKLAEWFMTTPPHKNLHAACALPSYKSPTGQVFDSFVIHDRDQWSAVLGKEREGYPEIVWSSPPEERERFARVNRRIVAALAVRTMRLNGQLPCRE